MNTFVATADTGCLVDGKVDVERGQEFTHFRCGKRAGSRR